MWSKTCWIFWLCRVFGECLLHRTCHGETRVLEALAMDAPYHEHSINVVKRFDYGALRSRSVMHVCDVVPRGLTLRERVV